MKKLFIFLMFMTSIANAQTSLRIIDGDTLVLDGQHYRLYGIDAPELEQTCEDSYDAGIKARDFLVNLIGSHHVSCASMGVDRYARRVGVCTIKEGTVDLSVEMVKNGMAWAYIQYHGRQYANLERAAKAANLGVHGARCMQAWYWREEEREMNAFRKPVKD